MKLDGVAATLARFRKKCDSAKSRTAPAQVPAAAAIADDYVLVKSPSEGPAASSVAEGRSSFSAYRRDDSSSEADVPSAESNVAELSVAEPHADTVRDRMAEAAGLTSQQRDALKNCHPFDWWCAVAALAEDNDRRTALAGVLHTLEKGRALSMVEGNVPAIDKLAPSPREPFLEIMTEHPVPIVRASAVWQLAPIDSERAQRSLDRFEGDPALREEVQHARDHYRVSIR